MFYYTSLYWPHRKSTLKLKVIYPYPLYLYNFIVFYMICTTILFDLSNSALHTSKIPEK